MRVLVTGSRDLPDDGLVATILAVATREGDTVVHGACPTGADAQADSWARQNARLVEAHPADWKAFGHAAGPMRNQAMIDSHPGLVLAFFTPGREHSRSRGTSMTVRMAHVAGLPVVTWGREQ